MTWVNFLKVPRTEGRFKEQYTKCRQPYKLADKLCCYSQIRESMVYQNDVPNDVPKDADT